MTLSDGQPTAQLPYAVLEFEETPRGITARIEVDGTPVAQLLMTENGVEYRKKAGDIGVYRVELPAELGDLRGRTLKVP